MTDHPSLSQLRARIAKAPKAPGVYRWKSAAGEVLYVGKAKNLRERMRSYVTASPDRSLGPWKRALREKIADGEWTVTRTELEALILETNLIKELRPKFNVLMKDDKNYVYVEITEDPLPCIAVVRRMENPKATYFGPYLSSTETKRILDMLHLVLGWRACAASVAILNAERTKHRKPAPRTLRPCLDVQIGQCNGLCARNITPEEYRRRVELVRQFFRGRHADVRSAAQALMQQAAAERKFERAAKLRDALKFMDSLLEKQSVADTSGEHADVFGVALATGRAQVCVLRKREGKIVGEEGIALRGEPPSSAEVLAQVLPQYYLTHPDLPDAVMLGEDIPGRHLLETWLSERRGKRVRILVPERGNRSRLQALAQRNAEEKLRAEETRWEAAERNVRDALEELQRTLGLPAPPGRIEAYDISHLSGTATVGSMVVAVQGKPTSKEYRSFTIRTLREGAINDCAALQEVLRRRLRHLAADIRTEEASWKESGVVIGRPRREEQQRIGEILGSQGSAEEEGVPTRKTLVARRGADIVGLGQLRVHPDHTVELSPVWVAAELQGKRLEQLIARKLLASVKKEKVYATPPAAREEEYSALGFRRIDHVPDTVRATLEAMQLRSPGVEMVAMMAEPKARTVDPSLTARPDLLVMDGGKGQLAAACAVLDAAGVTVPVISLAKREEEVFARGRAQPIALAKDSQAVFLLMRLRDEAHRFANAHRSKRIRKQSMASVLDAVPGIGPHTRNALLRTFGSVEGIRAATDDQLSMLLTQAQLSALREALQGSPA